MPWQHQVSGLLADRSRSLIVVTVQRQSGKTRWSLVEATDRCLHTPGQRVWYTANTGAAAREKWLEFTDELLAIPALASKLRRTLTNGSEKLVFPNGSQLRPYPPTRDSIHGKQSDLVIVDECWSFDAIRGQELMQAISPTQATRPGAQVLLLSSAGTAESTWWRGFVNRGRAGGEKKSMSYAEWSIPDGADPSDLDLVASHHPAIGRTIDRSFLDREWATMADAPAEFGRAYGNAWSKTQERAVPAALWAAAATTTLLPAGRPCFGADIALDRSRAAIVAVNNGIIEVIESRQDHGWVANRLIELIERHNPCGTVVDNIGPSAALHDELTRRKVKLLPFTARDYAAASETFLSGLGKTVHHRRHPALDQSVDNAAKRPLGDGGWAWGRRRASGPICELTAATFALYADLHRPAEPVRPYVTAG